MFWLKHKYGVTSEYKGMMLNHDWINNNIL